MTSRIIGLSLGLSLLIAASAAAQEPGATAERLREDIAELQAALDRVERERKGDTRVTQLGAHGRTRPGEPQLIVRIYDLSDLFAVAPTYSAKYRSDLVRGEAPLFPSSLGETPANSSGMGGMGGGGFFSVGKVGPLPTPEQSVLAQFSGGIGSADSSRASLDSLIEAIQSTISVTEWDEVGGPGSIAKLGNSLIISAELRTHDQIEALFNLFRKRWGTLRTISVRAHWLWLSDQQVAELLPGDDKRATPDGRLAYGIVNPQAWQQTLDAAGGKQAGPRAGYRAAITCYNGQTVHTLSGSQSLAVTQIQTELSEGGEKKQAIAAYQPVVSVVQEGAALQVTPVANQSGKYVVLDVHSLVSLREAAETKPAAAAPAKDPAVAALQAVVTAIDRPRLSTHRLSTTVRAPVDQVMLVGGMTFDAEPQPDGPHLYLFVKASVQELRDDIPGPLKPNAQDDPAEDAAGPAEAAESVSE